MNAQSGQNPEYAMKMQGASVRIILLGARSSPVVHQCLLPLCSLVFSASRLSDKSQDGDLTLQELFNLTLLQNLTFIHCLCLFSAALPQLTSFLGATKPADTTDMFQK